MTWWMFACLAALTWGFHYNILAKAMTTISPLTAYWMPTTIMMLGLPFFGKQVWSDLQSTYVAPLEVKISVATIAFTSLLASICLYKAIQMHNPVHAGLIEVTYPLYIALFAALFFNQNHLNIGTVIGGVLILLGAVIVIYTNG